MWNDLKRAVHRRSPLNLKELFCKEEWDKIPKSRCVKLIETYSERLDAVINAKGASTSISWAGCADLCNRGVVVSFLIVICFFSLDSCLLEDHIGDGAGLTFALL